MPIVAPSTYGNLSVGVFIDDLCALKLMVESVQFNSPLLIPNFRELMAEAAHFTNMQATVPICKASRTSMYASQTPIKTKVWNNEVEDYENYDYTQSWVSLFKQQGQVDGIGKLTHEPDPNQAIIDACYNWMHIIVKNAVKEVEVFSATGITGTPGQVFENVQLVPKSAASNANAAYCTITLDGSGTGIASVEVTEKRDHNPTTFAYGPPPRFQAGTSGQRLEAGDTMGVDGLGLDPVTGDMTMPDARIVFTVTKLTTFFYYANEGPYGYGTFTDGATVLKGDNLIADYFGTELSKVLAQDDQSRRLVLLGFKGPHTPLVPDQEYLDMHPLNRITIPDGYDEPSPFMLRYLLEDAATELYDAGKLQTFAQYYLAEVEEVDARLGTVMQGLKDAGIWDKTNFFVWSDHSYQIGNQNSAALLSGIYKKFKNFGTATCCEFFMRNPTYPVRGEIKEAVSSMDIGPTMLAMAGIPIPDYMEGLNLFNALRSPDTWRNDRAALSFCFGNISAVKCCSVPGGYEPVRLVRMFNGEELLYRDDIDPLNKTNLIGQGIYRGVLAEMRLEMTRELTRLGLGTDLFLQYDAATISGGDGNDAYIVGSPDVIVTDVAGNDQMIIQYSDQTIEDILIPEGIEYAFIDPTMVPSKVTVGDGGTQVVGTLIEATGGAGNDRFEVSGSGGTGLLADGKGGDDYIRGTENKDDSLYGGSGNDTLKGSSGNDILDGGGGDNRLGGGGDDDVLTTSTGNDSLYGGGGKDTLYAGGGIDSIQGDAGNDLIYAGAGNDFVYGGQGGDTMYGEGGDDILKPGRGANIMYGGTGANIFEIGFLTESSRLEDWSAGTGNKVRFIPGLGFGDAGASGASILTIFLANSTNSGSDCLLTIPDSHVVITFVNKLKASFTAADFEVEVFEELDIDDDSGDGGNND